MIFDKNGLPKDSGATDFMDSARLAGLMKLFGYPSTSTDLTKYESNGTCVRYPFVDPDNAASNNPKNVTRDQLIPLVAGFHGINRPDLSFHVYMQTKARCYRAQNTEADVAGSKKPFYNGADFMFLSDMNHLRMCAGLKPSLLGLVWLRLEIFFFNRSKKLPEPNQLLAKAVVAGPKYVKAMRDGGKLYPALKEYWGGWRNEMAFAEFIISKIDGVK